MDKHEEYCLRNELELFVKNKIDSFLDEYHQKYLNNIGFLLYYPLYYFEYDLLIEQDKLIEEHISKGTNRDILMKIIIPNLQKSKMKNLDAVTWFMKEMNKRTYGSIRRFDFSISILEEFHFMYNQILEIYEDYINSNRLKKRLDISDFNMTQIGKNEYELSEVFRFEKMIKESIYFYGLHNEEFQDEIDRVMESEDYIFQKYNYFNAIMLKDWKGYNEISQQIEGLKDKVDFKLLDLCIDRVSVDIDKLGQNVQSDVITDIEEYKKIIGYFYYLSRVNLLKIQNRKFRMDDFQKNLLLKFNYSDLINRLHRALDMDKKSIRKYMDYLLLDSEKAGGLKEFPIIKYKNRVVFSMTSIMLNDFQFSIPKGHEFKGIVYCNKRESISKTSENNFKKKADEYKNILCVLGYNYNLENVKTSNGKDMKGDIDCAIYDKDSNRILIIECKWKENLYKDNRENRINIIDACRKIYDKQLKKHEEYFMIDPLHITDVFKEAEPNLIINSPEIFYIATDKRVQYHENERHIVSEYMLLYLMRMHSEEGKLKLKNLIDEIKGMKTVVESDDAELEKCIRLQGKEIKHNVFNLEYEFEENIDFESPFD